MSPPRAGLTPRAKVLLPLFLITLLVVSYFRVWRGDAKTRFQGQTMGTTYHVIIGADADGRRDGLNEALQAELDRLEALMSTYRADSELMRLNRQPAGQAMPLSPHTARVLAAGKQISQASNGAFDITVGPLVAAWGFGAGAQVTPPTDDQLSQIRKRIGYQQLEVSESPPSATKQRSDLQLDLSAIAKGYAVDELGVLLERRGIHDYLVEVGGELKAAGEKSEGRPWRVGIEVPDADVAEAPDAKRGVKQAVELRDLAMATSGDYRNYYERDGKRISHTIDARSGRPITHALASVSVLHESAMMADGYATALNVLGPDEGMALAEKLDLAVYFIVRSGDAFETRSSARFSELAKPVNR